MKHISILIPQGHTSMVNIEGTHQIFNEVNSLLAGMEKPPLFKVQLVGISEETRQRNGLFIVSPDVLIKDVKKTDLIIIPFILYSKFKTYSCRKQPLRLPYLHPIKFNYWQ